MSNDTVIFWIVILGLSAGFFAAWVIMHAWAAMLLKLAAVGG